MLGYKLFRQPSHKYKETLCSIEDKAAFFFRVGGVLPFKAAFRKSKNQFSEVNKKRALSSKVLRDKES